MCNCRFDTTVYLETARAFRAANAAGLVEETNWRSYYAKPSAAKVE